MDGQLARLGAEKIPGDAHEVTDVEQLVEFPVLHPTDRILADVNLQARSPSGQVREPCLPMRPNGHHSARHAHSRVFGRQFLGRPRRVARQNLGQRMGEFKAVGVELEAERANGA